MKSARNCPRDKPAKTVAHDSKKSGGDARIVVAAKKVAAKK